MTENAKEIGEIVVKNIGLSESIDTMLVLVELIGEEFWCTQRHFNLG